MKNLFVFLAVAFFGLFLQRASAQCTTDAGTIQPASLVLCLDAPFNGSTTWFTITHNNNFVNDGNDIKRYVMHDGTETSLGNIIASFTSTFIEIPANVQPGITYQVAVIAGNPDGSGNVDLADPCMDFSGGVSVTYQPVHSVTLPAVVLGCGDYEVDLNATIAPPGNYEISWERFSGSDPAGNTTTITLTEGGWYAVHVYNPANLCWRSDTVQVVQEPGKPGVSIAPAGGSTCGQMNVTANVTGGIAPVSFAWSNGVTDAAQVLTPGSYCVSVTSGNGCVGKDCIVVAEPSGLSVSLDFFQSSNCGQSRLEAVVANAAGNVAYQWSSGGGTAWTNNQFALGENYVTVTDGAGCQAVASYFVETAPVQCGALQVRLFNDLDLDCAFNGSDFRLEGFKLTFTGANQNAWQGYANNDIFGFSWTGKLDPGTYTVSVELPNALWQPCQPSYSVTITEGGTILLDLPLQAVDDCTDLRIDFASLSELNWCNPSNYATIFYENKGTVPATGAYFELQMLPGLSFTATSVPVIDLGNDNYRFDLGTVGIGEKGYIYLTINVDCSVVLGSTPCLQATIFPNAPCDMLIANWSGASLKVTGECQGDGVHFFVENIGTAAMTVPLDYVIIEDAVMFMDVPDDLSLGVGEIKEIVAPATGATWRIEVAQEPNHPGFSMPALAVEGCTAFGTQGFVNLFPQDDADSFVDIECVEITASYDPNDKLGLPLGFGDQHLIEPGTAIEYTIRFQNTGTDTAETVVIRDTLSAWLDPLTVEPGAASHPYRFDFYGDGTQIKFVFDNIMLLDSNLNEPASHGFVNFRVKPRADVPLGSDIFNSAAIYFDYNPPIFTNTTQHRIGENFLISATGWHPASSGLELVVAPNPMLETATVLLKGQTGHETLTLEMFDLLGRRVHLENAPDGRFTLRRGDLAAGVYSLRVRSGSQQLGFGKLVVGE